MLAHMGGNKYIGLSSLIALEYKDYMKFRLFILIFFGISENNSSIVCSPISLSILSLMREFGMNLIQPLRDKR